MADGGGVVGFSQFVGVAAVGDGDVGHAGGAGGFKTRGGIFEHKTPFRRQAHSFGGLEEQLGVRLADLDQVAVGDRPEKGADVQLVQHEIDVVLWRVAGGGTRDACRVQGAEKIDQSRRLLHDRLIRIAVDAFLFKLDPADKRLVDLRPEQGRHDLIVAAGVDLLMIADVIQRDIVAPAQLKPRVAVVGRVVDHGAVNVKNQTISVGVCHGYFNPG